MSLYEDKVKLAVNGKTGVCVGLDPVLTKLPMSIQGLDEPFFEFNRRIIEATSAYASAYKPNLAFYEVLGADGWRQLEKTIQVIPRDKLVIADAKRGDIGNTAVAYASAMFEKLGADAVTVNPYLGSDAVSPFVEREDKGIFLLVVTSNKGASELQQLEANGRSIFQHVLDMGGRLNQNRNVGFVVGATDSVSLPKVLAGADNSPLLIPGVGAQGGDIQALRLALKDYAGPVLVNSSRGIIYASNGDDFAETAGIETQKLFDELNN
ncbi:orotidine-5'-phosphate decarboxylase [Calditrichota bacterium]